MDLNVFYKKWMVLSKIIEEIKNHACSCTCCTANPVLLHYIWAELAILINWENHDGSCNFGFPGLRSFISDKGHWYLSSYIFVTYFPTDSWRDFVDETGTNNDGLYFFTFFWMNLNKIKLFYKACNNCKYNLRIKHLWIDF